MPRIYDFLHYRIVDVSTIKELCKRWLPTLKAPPKKETHRALDDIRESIEELKFYKSMIFDKVNSGC
jgi:oligoribonuclease